MELGAWYTVTNAVDPASERTRITATRGFRFSIPSSPAAQRYSGHDRLLARALDAASGQMVKSPADLYDMLEKPLMIDLHSRTAWCGSETWKTITICRISAADVDGLSRTSAR